MTPKEVEGLYDIMTSALSVSMLNCNETDVVVEVEHQPKRDEGRCNFESLSPSKRDSSLGSSVNSASLCKPHMSPASKSKSPFSDPSRSEDLEVSPCATSLSFPPVSTKISDGSIHGSPLYSSSPRVNGALSLSHSNLPVFETVFSSPFLKIPKVKELCEISMGRGRGRGRGNGNPLQLLGDTSKMKQTCAMEQPVQQLGQSVTENCGLLLSSENEFDGKDLSNGWRTNYEVEQQITTCQRSVPCRKVSMERGRGRGGILQLLGRSTSSFSEDECDKDLATEVEQQTTELQQCREVSSGRGRGNLLQLSRETNMKEQACAMEKTEQQLGPSVSECCPALNREDTFDNWELCIGKKKSDNLEEQTSVLHQCHEVSLGRGRGRGRGSILQLSQASNSSVSEKKFHGMIVQKMRGNLEQQTAVLQQCREVSLGRGRGRGSVLQFLLGSNSSVSEDKFHGKDMGIVQKASDKVEPQTEQCRGVSLDRGTGGTGRGNLLQLLQASKSLISEGEVCDKDFGIVQDMRAKVEPQTQWCHEVSLGSGGGRGSTLQLLGGSNQKKQDCAMKQTVQQLGPSLAECCSPLSSEDELDSKDLCIVQRTSDEVEQRIAGLQRSIHCREVCTLQFFSNVKK